ncbi:serine/threonine protein kinase [Agromyces sp. CF514]|uniref:protein kinase domain-containing protein n=1 Tax=Agromyces sp. CF514 TaxID=1881031 RepID=UPI0008EBA8B0|nr:PASTA domain-containing protein [Agromyces sp. CF514]SFR82588.1 serine/threonine protein kinase [Agromyces sp. CF514]
MSVGGEIAGRYRLGELLGSGGSASVFAAVDTGSGDRVALKILHPHLSGEPAARTAFLDVARRTQTLRHANIAAVLETGVHDEAGEPVAWIALELADGSSLAEHVERSGALDPVEALGVMDGVLGALEAAHAVGLIHRDVSPANIMVAAGEDGRVGAAGARLLDFGLADAAGQAAVGRDVLRSETVGRADQARAEASGEDAEAEYGVDGRAAGEQAVPVGVIGNVAYMSPEQLRGEAVDERGDIYQAGGVLHFALTGRPPFARTSAVETMRAHLSSPPPVASVLDSRIPRSIDRIVVRALLKDPADRFPDAASMRAEVVDALARAGSPAAGAAGKAGFPGAGIGAGIDAVAWQPEQAGAGRTPGPKQDHRTRVLGATSVPIARNAASETTAVIRRRPSVPPASTRATASTADARAGSGPRRLTGGSTRAANRARLGAWAVGIASVAAVSALIAFAAGAAPVNVPTTGGSSAPRPPSTAAPSPAAPTAAPADVEDHDAIPEPPQPIASLGVPALAGLTLAEARSRLAEAGLRAGSLTIVESSRPGDTVLASTPVAGTNVAADSTVDLEVASGSNRMPEVTGASRADAVAAAQSAGFSVDIVFVDAPGSEAGTVIGTQPSAGTSVRVGATITLRVASEQQPEPTPTPTPPSPTQTPKPGAP